MMNHFAAHHVADQHNHVDELSKQDSQDISLTQPLTAKTVNSPNDSPITISAPTSLISSLLTALPTRGTMLTLDRHLKVRSQNSLRIIFIPTD